MARSQGLAPGRENHEPPVPEGRMRSLFYRREAMSRLGSKSHCKASHLYEMADGQDSEADEGDEEGEVFDAFHGVGIVQRDVEDARYVAGQEREGDGDVQEHVGERRGTENGNAPEQQVESEGNEEVGEFISVQKAHIPLVNEIYIIYSAYGRVSPAIKNIFRMP